MYALTIFFGAFLLFQVQPLMGKYVLPWFGGGPGVWSTCLLFFQALLVAGYAYAYAITRWLRPRAQAMVHLAFLLAALALLPIAPSDSWRPPDGEHPVFRILLLLTGTVGLPYLVLSSTGPLLQQWFTRTYPGRSPWGLYALSNTGSLLALVTYPVWFETQFSRKTQAAIWAWAFAVFAVGSAACGLRLWRRPSEAGTDLTGLGFSRAQDAPGSQAEIGSARPTPLLYRSLWLVFPACASALLLAVTNKLCLDVASIPFLWVLPLALYLLSFILCFAGPRWYGRLRFILPLVAALAGIGWALCKGSGWPVWRQVGIYVSGLFVCCMVCHGELYRLRPHPRELTGFYLSVSVGGALGGLFVAVIAPLIFPDYFELHSCLLVCGGLFLLVCLPIVRLEAPEPSAGREALGWRWTACLLTVLAFASLDRFLASRSEYASALPHGWSIGLRVGLWLLLAPITAMVLALDLIRRSGGWRWLACGWMAIGLIVLASALSKDIASDSRTTVYRSRNFYGVLKVCEYQKDEPLAHYSLLEHGRIIHGLQFADPQQARWPTTYYGHESGLGLAFEALPAAPRRIGVVGLGVGTTTAYAREGDSVRVYEINPDVQRLAISRFSYLINCPGRVEIAPGDARLSLEREGAQHFDLLALDAFSSDSIPVHLLTREAFAIYGRHLRPGGILAIHTSNHFLHLEPVVRRLARECHYAVALVDADETEEEWWIYASTWMLLCRDASVLRAPVIVGAAEPATTNQVVGPLWTDDFTSVFGILR